MRVAVVGAGPAGITAACLLQRRGYTVEVFEQADRAGGRTRTEHFGGGHWLDTGAGWLTDFYPRTMALLRSEGLDALLRPLALRGGGDLLLDGELVPSPNSVGRVLRSSLLSPADKARFLMWMSRLIITQKSDLRTDLRYDDVPAMQALSGMGIPALERIVRPMFEGPFFARLEQMNGTLVRSWLRSLAVGHFYQVEGGMDHPWRQLAQQLSVVYSTTVRSLEVTGSGASAGARLNVDGTWREYDAVVLAVPAPAAARILGAAAPAELSKVEYAPHVRAYLARPTDRPVPRTGVHIFPNEVVATFERGDGAGGAWGRVPDGWEWALVCAPSASSAGLLQLSRETALDRLFDEAESVTGIRLDWRSFPVAHLVRWQHAVPVVGTAYYGRLRTMPLRPPVLFAGDWRVQPCVEGAVRSAEAAVTALAG